MGWGRARDGGPQSRANPFVQSGAERHCPPPNPPHRKRGEGLSPVLTAPHPDVTAAHNCFTCKWNGDP
ncbi:hypothetical protein BOS5A_10543 [Bosea sp. EC-HK365B]|nr:hypothetical protein BOSE46_10320 [Bosea sp. 46]CAD5250003.1 hypothetical protein BOSE21B_10530 [Bosea sp. 21B]CAD5265867.1 hypothetical protein BOSE7B_150606 [Bosea sp. 7B]VVT44652.1 hypothetical protein BOS5A_10543 [Bosea sp. EC-HK365B]VXB05773.1 hypothetical protein BOSE29B_10316 [Bosea sp. 29B]VXC48569.1 hypothetical protein BOSE127_190234 [Bosea sp. 127]